MLQDFFDQYPQYHRLVASGQLILAMFGMGAVTRPQAFVEIVLEPKPMIVGALYQLIGIPLITAAMMLVFHFPPEIMVGFFMVAAMPGGSMSNIYTHLGKGNAALSVALTGLMTLLALFTTPLILKIFAYEYVPPEIVMPVGVIMREIFVFLLLPLSIGMIVGKLIKDETSHVVSKWAVRVSLFILGILVIGSLGSGSIEFSSYAFGIPFAIFLYCLIIQVIILRGSLHVLKFSLFDSTALGIESSMKNINLSLLIAASLFGLQGEGSKFGGGVLYVLLMYGGISLCVAAVPVITSIKSHEKHRKRQLLEEDGVEST